MKGFCFFVYFFSGQIPEGVLIFCIFLLQSDLWRSSDFFFLFRSDSWKSSDFLYFFSSQIPEEVLIWFFIFLFWSDPWKSSDFFSRSDPCRSPDFIFFSPSDHCRSFDFIFLFRSDPWKSSDFFSSFFSGQIPERVLISFFFFFFFFLSDPWRRSDFYISFPVRSLKEFSINGTVEAMKLFRPPEATKGTWKAEIPTYHPGSWNTYLPSWILKYLPYLPSWIRPNRMNSSLIRHPVLCFRFPDPQLKKIWKITWWRVFCSWKKLLKSKKKPWS